MNEDSFEKYKCSQCNKKTKVKRLIVGGSGMIFKGSGFYLTDYTNYGKADKTEKPIEKKLLDWDKYVKNDGFQAVKGIVTGNVRTPSVYVKDQLQKRIETTDEGKMSVAKRSLCERVREESTTADRKNSGT